MNKFLSEISNFEAFCGPVLGDRISDVGVDFTDISVLGDSRAGVYFDYYPDQKSRK